MDISNDSTLNFPSVKIITLLRARHTLFRKKRFSIEAVTAVK